MSAPPDDSVPVRPAGPAPSAEAADPAAAAAKPGSLVDQIELWDTPGHLLRRAQQRAVDLYWQAVGEDGLRPPQFAVLVTVYQNPGLNQTELVRRTGIDRSTAADIISRLAKRGLVTRQRTDEDQRANRLVVTEAGMTALEHSAAAVESAQAAIMAPIPPEQRETFIALMKLMAELPPDAPDR